MLFLPLELPAYDAGCAPMKRPAALDLFLVAALSFGVSALCAAATDLIPWKLRELPTAMRWRARATVASLHQPVAVLFLLPPSEALEIFLFTGGNQWTISAPRNLWLTLFYLLGAWFFELLILLHPSTGATKSYGRRGWSVQAAHHLGFPAFALHNIISGCAVPGTAVACYTELTVFFTSSFWIAKMVGAGDLVLVPIKVGMVIFTFVLRGGCVLLLDLRAILNDQSSLPVASWLTQCLALVGMNVLNLLILRLVSGAVMRGSKVDSGWTSTVMERALKLAMHHLGPAVSERILLEMQNAHEDSSHPSSLERLFQLFRQPPFLEEKAAVSTPIPNGPGSVPGGGHVEAQPCPSVDGVDREKLREMMMRLAAEAAGFPVEAEKPLLDSGMDSKAALQFSNKLSRELPGLRLPSTLVFDYPTLSAVAAYAEEAQRPRDRKEHRDVKKQPVASSPSSSDPLSVIGAACAFPGDACSPGKFGALLASGTDGIVEVPFTRWELCEYYDPNPDAPGKMYPCHAAFIEGAEDFAASYFNISAPEARAMDPQQRLVLEVCHDSLLDSTFSREALLGSSTAAIVGVSNNDWIQVQSGDIRKLNPYTATGTSASVAAARVAFCLGLKGPAYVVDTACSSALVAVDAAAMNLRRGRCSAAVSAAANVIASPATFISFSKPRMLSPRGQSHAFDASADGYGRGEGAGAVALCPLKADGSARAALRGTAVNQDGRSSTMTAPNGPSQTMVVATALAEAMLSHHQVRHFEAHGTGTPLGDPIEVGALQAGSLDEGPRQQPVGVAAVKTNVGHLEGAAASPGLLKTMALLSRRTALSLVHLHALNPHLTLLEDVPQVFPSEHFPLAAARKPRTGGLSSFGFGGTNAHAILGESEVVFDIVRAERPAEYVKKSFPWRDPGYRLLRRQDGDSFEVTMSSDVYDTVSHHVVFGSIVTPGVVYVEMALEATRKLFGHKTQLRDVTMVFPFVVPKRFESDEPEPSMRFVLKNNTRFEIQSTNGSGKTTVHVEASLDHGGSGVFKDSVDLASLRDRITEPVETKVVYEAIHSVGLYLGPMFQVAKELWRDPETGSEVLGHLRLDPHVKNVGYIMHPALLDGTIHILATASIGKNVTGLKIFGGVGKVSVVRQENFSKLSNYWVHLQVTESLEASQTFNVSVLADDGGLLMSMEDVVFRAVKPEQIQMAIAAQGGKEEQTIYDVEWSEWSEWSESGQSSTPSSLLAAADTPDLHHALCNFRTKPEQTLTLEALRQSDLDLALLLPKFSRILLAFSSQGSSALEALMAVLAVLQALAKTKGSLPELWISTFCCQWAKVGDFQGQPLPLHSAIWGLARTARNELPNLRLFSTDLGPSLELSALEAQFGADSADSDLPEHERALRKRGEGSSPVHVLYVPRLQEVSLASAAQGWSLAAAATRGGPILITGGLGALGLCFAQWLLEQKAGEVALVSRTGRAAADSQVAFRRVASKVTVHRADLAKAEDTRKLLQQPLFKDLRGIIHAAGLLEDHMIVDLNREHFERPLAAKIDGTLNLNEGLSGQQLDLEFFALFSSVAALLGTPAQGNYCAGNAFLDSFAAHCRENGRLKAVSIQWGPWAEVGMAARANTSESSIARLSPAKGLEAMHAILAAQSSLRSGVVAVARFKWTVLLGQLPRVPAFLSKFSTTSKGSKGTSNYTVEDVRSLVVESLTDALGTEDFDINTPLMELGLDSLAGVEFRNRLQASVDGINLTPTLMFDYPTVPDLVEYIWSQVGPAEEEELVAVQATAVGSQLIVAGHSGRFPGSLSNHPGDFWRTLASGLDTTADLPPERWDMDAFFDPDPDTPGKTYVRLGHFILGIEQFDGEFFGLSEMEQRGMDPHQWLTLEITYDSMFAAGLTKEKMNGLDCGIYVGCATLGGIAPDIPAFGPFTNIGYAYSGLSGRVSHTLSLRGPCFTVDTACSATVVALDCASQALKLGRCRSAAASGVNLQLSAAIWVGFAKMRGLAADGNCKTFDSSADGFARGEGMGSVYIAMEDANTTPAALLGGVATNHDGRAATITAPNGTAQQRVIRAALSERGTRPEALGCLECHGTGTALGDPIEVGAQKAVYGKGREAPIILAAGKTNLGHLEGAAGVAGLSKTVLLLQKAQVTPLLWLKQLNHNVELSNFGFAPTELLDARRAQGRAAVSSFGFSGTNGHAILEVFRSPTASEGPGPRRPTAGYSRRLLQPYRQWLKDICYEEVWIGVDAKGELQPQPLHPLQPFFLVGSGAVCIALAASSACAGNLESGGGREEIAEALAQTRAKTAVFVGSSGEAPDEPLAHLLSFLQALQLAEVDKAVVVTVSKGGAMDSGAALWGLARSARLEMRSEIRLLECLEQAGSAVLPEVQRLLSGPEMEISVRDAVKAPRLQRSAAASDLQSRDVLQGQIPGASLVTGGLGGLGLLAAQQLAELGAKTLILASRSGRAANSAALARLELAKAVVEVRKCDVSRAEDIAALTQSLQHLDKLHGIVHAAGVLDRCALKDLTSSRLDVTLGPKAKGAWHLQCLSERLVMFSSVSSFLGLSNGAAYAAANAYLDALASWRNTQSQGTAVSVRFGPVADIGMAAESGQGSEDTPLRALPLAQVSSGLRLLLAPQPLRCLAPLTLARADWSAYFRQSAGLAPMLQDFQEIQVASASETEPEASERRLRELSASEREKAVLASLHAAASSMHLDIQEDSPLMEAGIDSLSAVEFRGKISTEFRSVRLPSTLMFDHPTLKAISQHISVQLAEGSTPVASSPISLPVASPSTVDLEVRGAACTLPAPGPHACSLWYGTDCVTEMPYSRWDVEDYYDPDAPSGLEMYVRHAAFVEGVELFGAQFFGISKVEAEAMDPQQRHLLETAFGAFGDSGYSKAGLMGLRAGVFVGQDKSDWNRMLSAAHAGPFAATGGSASISSNRISYSLGLKGPSATVDTACSSSLVAADTAATTIRRGRCEVAAVCGVNMLLLPQTFIACCQARMLSADGRCHTFDASASGYARGEGCGAQILGPAGSAAPSVDSVAAFAGSALNQDGRSANLTSPNGPSQKAVIEVALLEGGLRPDDVGQVETHGTGTELGDPIETGALRAALGSRSFPLLLGAVKSNLGHLEGGAGMAGLLKLASQLQHPVPAIAANLHLRALNPHIAEDAHDFAALFPNCSVAGKVESSAASVSSFGFGGTNGCVVLRLAEKARRCRPLCIDLGRERFEWREPSHPLIRKKARREDGVHVLSCPIDGHVLELLSHHIVHGEVVVPGACYLEMILAGVRAHLGQQEAWCIESLGFAKPLVLRLSQSGQLEEPVELRLLIWEDGRLEVESAVGEDPEDHILSTHVEASLIRQAGGWKRAEEDKHDLAQLRRSCPEEVDVDLMYSFGVKSGLPLQRRFRCVRQVQVQKSERKGFARLEMERDGTELGFLLGPSLIDSSFQALMALADPAVGIGSLKIPLSIKRLQPMGRRYSIGVWSHFELLDWTEHSTAFRCWLLNDAGETLLFFDSVHLQEVRDEHLQKVLQASGRLGAEQQALYSTLWRPLPKELTADGDGSRKWLILGRQEDLRQSAMEEFRCIAAEDNDFQDEAALQELFASFEADALVFVGGLGDDSHRTSVKCHGTDDVDVLALALHVLRAALSAGLPLVFLTKKTQDQPEPIHAGLWGFARTARLEEPDRLRLACVDLDSSKPLEAIEAALTQLSKSDSREEELSWHNGEVLGRRLTRSELKAQTPMRLNMPARGALTGLRGVPQTRQPLVLGSVQLRIRAVGLNFRDVLNVMGLYPGDPGPPGADMAGTVLDLAEHTGDHLRLAEDVFGEAPGCLSSYCLAPAPLIAPKPSSWSFEEACTMPVIFVTVEEALGDLAQLKRGERVLIHAAAGGVGLVAIQYAQYIGAEVYATAGAEEKHEYLRSIGVKHITSSRNGARFEEEMRSFLEKEGLEGVDVVLNSLSHDDYIPRSLAFLRNGGRFLEIGKRGIWSHQQMHQSRPDVMYEKIAADTMMEREPWRYNAYLKRLKDRVDSGALKPIHMHIFDGLEEGVRALQFLQRAQNIGKVVISQSSKLSKLPAGTHVLSGGTGALGVVTAQFLAEEGVKSLCLLSRAGRPPEEVQARWNWLQASTLQLQVLRCDISEEASVRSADVSQGPVVSLFHLAGALADAMLPALDRQLFLKSYGAKVHGLRHLLRLLGDVALTVLFSSTSSLFGAPGQGNYAAANSTLDAFAAFADRDRGACVSVQWGPWAEVGMAVQKGTVQRAKASGIGSLSNPQGMAILASVICQTGEPRHCLVGAAHVRWPKFLRSVFNATPPASLLDLAAEAAKSTEGAADAGSGISAELAALGPEERRQRLEVLVQRLASDVVGEDLSGDVELLESGMDSLSGVEFRNRLQQELGGIRLPNSAVFDFPTANMLAGFIAGQFSTGPMSDEAAPTAQVTGESKILQLLNNRMAGPGHPPLFLVPGAGLQAAGFQALASLLPVATWSVSWPQSLPRERWPDSLEALAELLLAEVRAVVGASEPLLLAGHSFGATVCLEMARQAEASAQAVSLVMLLDPRTLLPVAAGAGGLFDECGILETVAMLSQSVADGSRYASVVEESASAEDREEAVRRLLGPQVAPVLEHIHETFRWYAGLLASARSELSKETALRARMLWVRAAGQAERSAEADSTSAKEIVQRVQAEIFQEDEVVAMHLKSMGAGGEVAAKAPVLARGDHFAMLHEPHVAALAMRLCHAIVEASAVQEDAEDLTS